MKTSDFEMDDEGKAIQGSDMSDGELLGEIISVTSGGMKLRLHSHTRLVS